MVYCLFHATNDQTLTMRRIFNRCLGCRLFARFDRADLVARSVDNVEKQVMKLTRSLHSYHLHLHIPLARCNWNGHAFALSSNISLRLPSR